MFSDYICWGISDIWNCINKFTHRLNNSGLKQSPCGTPLFCIGENGFISVQFCAIIKAILLKQKSLVTQYILTLDE